MLTCLNAKLLSYKKNEYIFTSGETNFDIGIIISGNINIIKEDYYGNINILNNLSSTNLFAESYVCAEVTELPVSVLSKTKSEIMFIEYKKIARGDSCCNKCLYKQKIIDNMTSILAKKNIILNEKLEHLTKKTTKEKVLSYLNEIARKTKLTEFDIPYNREELAAYLSVDRSALSKELSNMQKEGILSYTKNHFKLNI